MKNNLRFKIDGQDVLKAYVKTDNLKYAGCTVYMGYIEATLNGRYLWRDFGGSITRLTHADALMDAEKLIDEYFSILN